MRILAAPIQEYTDAAYRAAHARTVGGVEEYYAPFARLELGGIPERARRDLAAENNRHGKTVPQLLVRNAEETLTLLQWLASLGYARADMNLGCPFPKVTQHGYGAGMLADPEAVRLVLEAAASVRGIGVSVKMRLGMRSEAEAFALLPLLNAAPLVRIVLHPRTAEQQYAGVPDREAFRRFQDQCRHPVVLNGDIRSPEDASGLAEVMLGRGMLANPLLPLTLQGEHPATPRLLEFHRALVEECTRHHQQPLLKLKLHWDYLLPDAPRKLRKAIQKSRDAEEYLRLAEEAITQATA